MSGNFIKGELKYRPYFSFISFHVNVYLRTTFSLKLKTKQHSHVSLLHRNIIWLQNPHPQIPICPKVFCENAHYTTTPKQTMPCMDNTHASVLEHSLSMI